MQDQGTAATDVRAAVLSAAVIGGVAGAALGAHRGRRGVGLGGLTGAVALAASEAVAQRRPGEQ
ncbi:hypothetical protein ND748_32115 [Frankia sp. AiPs1]|uniref:hypothetical protein n=1 Tax=Frankia sp. AiPs1 TaxID=573493 RepID=UPI0020444319|nr:hypothetical protein [Frankia sp. AiPs1]MCM3926304.1 hypothetical protein [Frankia sp. AiPs1]